MSSTRSIASLLLLPIKEALTKDDGTLAYPWEVFLRNMKETLVPLGVEKNFKLVNNQATPIIVDGLSFNFQQISSASIDFLIQRVTTGTGAVEYVYAGTLDVIYLPNSLSWAVMGVAVLATITAATGVTLSIDADGQIKYATTNIAGTPSISKLSYRVRTLSAKASYSQVGRV